jgi:hypothetical protein
MPGRKLRVVPDGLPEGRDKPRPTGHDTQSGRQTREIRHPA